MLHKDLLNLPVFTQNDRALGRISGFEIDPDAQSIIRYYLKPHKLISFLAKELVVHRSQVVFLDKERMIVEDSVSKEKVKAEEINLGEETIGAAI